MSITNYYENVLLDYVFSTTRWVGLSTADPGEAGGTLAEPGGSAYARVEIPSSYWDDATGGTITTNTDLQFPRATGSWGTVTYMCLFDAASSGNLLWSGTLDDSLVVTSGIRPVFLAGDIVASLD